MKKIGLRSDGSDVDFNDSDVEFMQKMILHHEMALDMAANEHLNGKNNFALELALGIFIGQAAEIRQMEEWLKANGRERMPKGMKM